MRPDRAVRERRPVAEEPATAGAEEGRSCRRRPAATACSRALRGLAASLPRRVGLAALLGATALIVPPSAPAGAQDLEGMALRMRACTPCHGPQGQATAEGYFPRIAGKPAGYLYNQLVNFREGRRGHSAMVHLVTPLSDPYLREIAAYFSRLSLPYPPPLPARAPASTLERGRVLAREGDATRGIAACASCHGDALTGVRPAIPGLLGLPRDYVVAQLGAWRTGSRQSVAPDCMARIAIALAADDVAAVADWLASQPVPEGGRPAARLRRAMPLPCGSGG